LWSSTHPLADFPSFRFCRKTSFLCSLGRTQDRFRFPLSPSFSPFTGTAAPLPPLPPLYWKNLNGNNVLFSFFFLSCVTTGAPPFPPRYYLQELIPFFSPPRRCREADTIFLPFLLSPSSWTAGPRVLLREVCSILPSFFSFFFKGAAETFVTPFLRFILGPTDQAGTLSFFPPQRIGSKFQFFWRWTFGRSPPWSLFPDLMREMPSAPTRRILAVSSPFFGKCAPGSHLRQAQISSPPFFWRAANSWRREYILGPPPLLLA